MKDVDPNRPFFQAVLQAINRLLHHVLKECRGTATSAKVGTAKKPFQLLKHFLLIG
jgi:hypothetical protein